MTRRKYGLIFIVVTIIVSLIAAKLALSPENVRQFLIGRLERVLKSSQVTIREVRIDLFSNIRIIDIEISNPLGFRKEPCIQIGMVKVEYDIPCLLRGKLKRVVIKELNIRLQANEQGDWNLSHLVRKSRKGGRRRKAPFPGEVILDQGQIKIAGNRESDKEVTVDSIAVSVLRENDVLEIKTCDFRLCGGQISGVGEANLSSKDVGYKMEFKITNFNWDQICETIEPPQSKLNGRMSGNIVIEGKGIQLKELKGNFTSTGAGGVLKLTSAGKLAKYLSGQSQGEPLANVVEILSHFRYNEATIGLGFG